MIVSEVKFGSEIEMSGDRVLLEYYLLNIFVGFVWKACVGF